MFVCVVEETNQPNKQILNSKPQYKDGSRQNMSLETFCGDVDKSSTFSDGYLV